jgi:hypothetical protein
VRQLQEVLRLEEGNDQLVPDSLCYPIAVGLGTEKFAESLEGLRVIDGVGREGTVIM